MKTYEFTFQDGTKFIGEGEGEGRALHDAYLKNGFLPTVKLDVISTEETALAPPPPEPDSNPATDIRTKKNRRN